MENNPNTDFGPAPKCPTCGVPLVLRTNGSTGEKFWGCKKYPRCKGSLGIPSEKERIKKEKTKTSLVEKEEKEKEIVKTVAEVIREIEFDRVPSPMQRDFFDKISFSNENIFLSAGAGTGKSWTIKKGVRFLPKDEQIIMLAFNTSIALVLKNEIPDNVVSSTISALGNQNCLAYFRSKRMFSRFNPKKLEDIYERKLSELSEELKERYENIQGLVLRIVRSLKANIFEPTNENMESISEKHSLTFLDEPEFIFDTVREVFEESRKLFEYDFSDQVWLCATKVVPCKKYKYIIIDEGQDLSPDQIMMLYLSLLPGGRLIIVGDENQSIYGFRESDPDAVKKCIKLFNMTVMPLSVTYRCPKSHVALVNKEFPNIPFSCPDWQKEGKIENVNIGSMVSLVDENSLVLCRYNAPLVRPCYKLISQGIKAYIRGRDIGKDLKSLIRKVSVYNKTENLAEFVEGLYSYRMKESEKLLRLKQTNKLDKLNDQVESIEALSEGIYTVKELLTKIDEIFSDEKIGIPFSSVHRAKGEEAEKVFIIDPGNMPRKVEKDWEKVQELNIKYVAFTRSKDILYFVNTKDK